MKSLSRITLLSVLASVCLLGCSKELVPVSNANFTIESGNRCRISTTATCQASFRATQSGVQYKWTFQEGSPSTSEEANPTVRYTKAGSWKVTLVTIGEGGADVKSETIEILAALPVPTVQLQVLGKNACFLGGFPSCGFVFSATATNATQYTWRFGDGGTSSIGSTVSYTYTTPGVYPLTLEVVGAGGTVTTPPQSITVSRLTTTDAGKFLDLPFADLVTVTGGTFQMGDTRNDGNTVGQGAFDDVSNERPVRSVTLSNFALGKYEITQRQWQAVMGTNPTAFPACPDCPADGITWDMAQSFITRLNQLTGKTYRLPTEAEWEYAAGGGSGAGRTRFGTGNDILKPDEANFGSSPDRVRVYSEGGAPVGRTVAVGSLKKANRLGLFDMSGNVHEWVSDWYGLYTGASVTNPQGPAGTGLTEGKKVFRGGSWNYNAFGCRVSFRSPFPLANESGFRIAQSL
jgi:formylglycine-generating enzyme required for sulfatase activity